MLEPHNGAGATPRGRFVAAAPLLDAAAPESAPEPRRVRVGKTRVAAYPSAGLNDGATEGEAADNEGACSPGGAPVGARAGEAGGTARALREEARHNS